MANNNNNSNIIKSNMPEPTLLDVFNIVSNNATKQDMDDIKERIDSYKTATNEKFEEINLKVEATSSMSAENANKIEILQSNIELLKQEHLKCNICVSGVPPNLIKDENTAELFIQIAIKLGLDINRSQFSSYSIANNKFIIVKFHEHTHKQQLMGKIRTRKSLMVEEVFNLQSNSQIYINDHLTQYFNKLYLIARRAKKDGKLASATSFGGKIRARKQRTDAPILITNENQLLTLIGTEQSETTNESTQHGENEMETSVSSQPSNSQRSNSTNRNRTKQRKSTGRKNTEQSSIPSGSKKRPASNSGEEITTDKKTKK